MAAHKQAPIRYRYILRLRESFPEIPFYVREAMRFYPPRELGVTNGTLAHKGIPSPLPPPEFTVVLSRMNMDALQNVVSRFQLCLT